MSVTGFSRQAFWKAVRQGRRALKGGKVPVYEALFADGSFRRQSFWSDMRAPVNPADGRPGPYRYALEDVVHEKRSIAPPPQPVNLIAGWVEYNGGRWRDSAAGEAAINDGSPLAPAQGLPETPTREARDALKQRRNHETWLALLRRVKRQAKREAA